MDNRTRTNKAFTLIELVVAIAILAMMSVFAGAVFKVSTGSHRIALANAEIMQKLRTITAQLDADFKALRKDGEIFVVWTAQSVTDYLYDDDYDGDGHVRFDRIMFFAGGDFQSYRTEPAAIRGNVARISYMLANRPGPDGSVDRARAQPPQDRILARTQHILTAADLVDSLDYDSDLDERLLDQWHNQYEYDRISLQEWKNIPWRKNPDFVQRDEPNKPNILSAITGIRLLEDVGDFVIGSRIAPEISDSIHNILCQGVGEFKVQGWYAPLRRWVPEVDPDNDGDLTDTDFFLDPEDPTRLDSEAVPGVLYHPHYGGVSLGGDLRNTDTSYRELLNEEHFDEIPGLGRALMFTFTLYDSRGIIPEGRTFTHIVYLGD